MAQFTEHVLFSRRFCVVGKHNKLMLAKITIIPSTFTVGQKYNSIIGGFEFLANGPISVLL